MISYLKKFPLTTIPMLCICAICSNFFPGALAEPSSVYAQTKALNDRPAREQLFSEHVDDFRQKLVKAPQHACLKIFGRYNAIIENELSMEKLYFIAYKHVDTLLDKAVNASIDSLTLFTHTLLQDQKGPAIVFTGNLLHQINTKYNFHGLFYITIASTDGGPEVRMKFFVIGQGKFIVAYDRNAKIKHPDYDIVTGNYDYKELFIMDAKKDPNGNPGLFNIKGLSSPTAKPTWMKGPLNVDIHSFVMTFNADQQPQILIEYDLFGIKHKRMDPIPIEKLYDG